ncbi:MmgE/PrpD family protein [Alicyclobacillus curvatus]|nr:MmgE/PrpD family protein [Alicyclobacillus curvatus]
MREDEQLIRWISSKTWVTLPDDVKEHTLLSIFNYLAVAIHGTSSQAAQLAWDAVGSRVGDYPVLGQNGGSDKYTAALINGIAAHVDDYDDTHLHTVIHPCAPVVSSVIPIVMEQKCTGQEFLEAVALGCEIALRLGVAISPEHYDEGWHITSTCGGVGAALAVSKVMKLDDTLTSNAISMAGSQASGLQSAFGSMAKSLHAGIAAQNGLMSTSLVSNGLRFSGFLTNSPGSFVSVWGGRFEPSSLFREGSWELLSNSFKPYPCGVVTHPAIDAGIALSKVLGAADAIDTVMLNVNPLVLELTNKYKPTTGLDGKFSVHYCVAAALLDGCLDLRHFTDEAVHRSEVLKLQERIRVVPDVGVNRDSCQATVQLASGDVRTMRIEHATGSLYNPMNFEKLLEKAENLIDPVLGTGRAREIWAELEMLPRRASVNYLLHLTTA